MFRRSRLPRLAAPPAAPPVSSGAGGDRDVRKELVCITCRENVTHRPDMETIYPKHAGHLLAIVPTFQCGGDH